MIVALLFSCLCAGGRDAQKSYRQRSAMVPGRTQTSWSRAKETARAEGQAGNGQSLLAPFSIFVLNPCSRFNSQMLYFSIKIKFDMSFVC